MALDENIKDKANQIADTNDVLNKIKEVLNLPENLVSLEISLSLDHAPKISFETYIDNKMMKD